MDNNVAVFLLASVLQGDDLEQGGQSKKFHPKRQIEKQARVLLVRDFLLRLLSAGFSWITKGNPAVCSFCDDT